MNIHEYQAKELFRRAGLPVPKGAVARDPAEAERIAASLAPGRYVIKAQIHAGGRSKGGGVKIVHSPAEAGQAAEALLGKVLVTPQTGPQGRTVRAVLVEECRSVVQEYYAALTLDRRAGLPSFVISPAGGMDIEETAERHPERIFRVPVDPRYGLADFEGRRLAAGLGLKGKNLHEASALFKKMWRLYREYDALLVEINPLAEFQGGVLEALDAKCVFDDNALYRHPELKKLADPHESDPLELEAETHELSYVRLNGQIGAVVNGAGLAMATMDLIKQAGFEPANFLDVGGGAAAAKIAAGVRILLADTRITSIFVNIFGGILRCDILAEGLVRAAEEAASSGRDMPPLIVRMLGTNAAEGLRILKESGLVFTAADDLEQAAHALAKMGD